MSECPDNLRVRCLLCCQVLECKRADTSPLVHHIRDVHPEVTFQSSDELEPIAVKSTKSKFGPNSADPKDHKSLENEILEKIRSEGQKSTNLPVDIPGYGMRRSKINEQITRSTSNQLTVPPAKEPSKASVAKSQTSERKKTEVLYKRDYKMKKSFTPRQPGKQRLYKTSIEKWRPGTSTIVCPECGANRRPMIKSQMDKVSHSPLGAAFILTCWPFCFLPCLFPPPTKEYLHCAVCNHFLGIYDRKTEVINPNEESLRKTGGGGSSSSELIKDEQSHKCD